jgi:hypothetical protein
MNPTWQVAVKIADLFLEPRDIAPEGNKNEARERMTIEDPESMIGKYFFDDLNNWKKITLKNDSLYMNEKIPLIPLSENEFSASVSGLNTSIRFMDDSKMVMEDRFRSMQGYKFDDTPPGTMADVDKYIGRYRSMELNVDHEIYQDGERLMLRIADNEPIILFPDPTDKRINWNSKDKVWIGNGMIKFVLDKSGLVKGYYIGDSRVKGVYFEKLVDANK